MLFDQPATLEPEDILAWYDLCSAGLERERLHAQGLLVLEEALPSYLNHVLALGATQTEIDEYFISCQEELDLAAVLTLTASAEARLRLDAAERSRRKTDELAKRLAVLSANADAEWRVPLYEGGIADAWKTYVVTVGLPESERNQIVSAIGRFKEILALRHWVAHGRYWEFVRGIRSYPPVMVARSISALYDALRRIATHGQLMAFA
jgi:hypothetical protein